MGTWLVGWFMGESFAIGTLMNGDTPIFANTFMLFWLTGWTIGGAFAITMLFWLLVGVERISIEHKTLEIGKHIFSLKRTKKYDLNSVMNIAINPQPSNDFFGMNQSQNFFGLKGGVLKFDYGMKTIRFAGGIEEAEGRMLIDSLKENSNFNEKNFA